MENKPSAILIEPMYLPPISFYKTIKNCKRLHLEQKEFYRKGTYRNRCYLPTANGIRLLSVPLQKGKNENVELHDVKICHQQNWQKEHWKTICFLYRRSPFFEFYENDFKRIFETEFEKLLDWNLTLMKLIFEKLNWKMEFDFTQNFETEILEMEDFRNKISPKNDETLQLNLPKYHQVFEDKTGFKNNMSMLDLLCCEGPNTLSLI
jgi:hypothetical protein